MNTNSVQLNDVQGLGTILFVGAHPDDETFCCGGLLSMAVRNGQRVICITATRGEQGVQDDDRWASQELGDIRSRELAEALNILGIREHYWLNYADGECINGDERDACQEIAGVIERCGVDTVITFGPDGLTGHPDHQTMSRWVDGAVLIATREPEIYRIVQPSQSYYSQLKPMESELNIFFMIDKPPLAVRDGCDIYIELDHKSLVQKFRALEAMPSQTTDILQAFPAVKFKAAFGVEALVKS